MQRLKITLAAVFLCVFAVIPCFASDKKVSEVNLGTPSYARWEGATAVWGSVKKASQYQIKLYNTDFYYRDEDDRDDFDMDDDDLLCVATLKTTERSVDLSDYMEDGHTYFFAVRAVPKTNQTAYYTAGEWKTSGDMTAEMGYTSGTWRNYLEGEKYQTDSGFLSDGWHLINGHWYLFANGGYKQTGFVTEGGKDYLLDESGKLVCGWIETEEGWLYALSDGSLATGWIQDEPGQWYYMGSDHLMLTDCDIDGYHLDETGLMISEGK